MSSYVNDDRSRLHNHRTSVALAFSSAASSLLCKSFHDTVCLKLASCENKLNLRNSLNRQGHWPSLLLCYIAITLVGLVTCDSSRSTL